jgi:hypothetical protein
MLALPLFLLFGGLTVWGFFNLQTAGWVFITVAALFTCWLLAASWSLQSKWITGLEEKAFSEAESAIFRKYAFYFIYPFQAKQYSGTFSLLQALCLAWLSMSLWQREWVLMVCFIALFFVATNMAPFLNQGNFLRHHEKRGKLPLELLERKEVVESVEEKILEARTK